MPLFIFKLSKFFFLTVQCKPVELIVGGSVEPPLAYVDYKKTVTYTCDEPGYVSNDDAPTVATCGKDGAFDKGPPVCTLGWLFVGR